MMQVILFLCAVLLSFSGKLNSTPVLSAVVSFVDRYFLQAFFMANS
jgi:hypothetical protein